MIAKNAVYNLPLHSSALAVDNAKVEDSLFQTGGDILRDNLFGFPGGELMEIKGAVYWVFGWLVVVMGHAENMTVFTQWDKSELPDHPDIRAHPDPTGPVEKVHFVQLRPFFFVLASL